VKPIVSKILRALGVLFTLGLAWTGLVGAVQQYPGIHSTGQWFQTAFQLALGIFSVLSLIVTFRFLHWRRVVYPGLALSAGLAGGFASVAWGEQGLGIGLMSGVLSLFIGLVDVWLLRGGARHGPPASVGSIDS
jgi:hypothetical protein